MDSESIFIRKANDIQVRFTYLYNYLYEESIGDLRLYFEQNINVFIVLFPLGYWDKNEKHGDGTMYFPDGSYFKG